MALNIPTGLSPAAHKFAVFDAVYFKLESFFNFLSGLAIFGIITFDFAQSNFLKILAAVALLGACSAVIAVLTKPKAPREEKPLP